MQITYYIGKNLIYTGFKKDSIEQGTYHYDQDQ